LTPLFLIAIQTALQTAAQAPGNQAAGNLLVEAEKAMTAVDYPRSRDLVEQALERGGLPRAEVTRAYRLLALSCAQIEDRGCAQAAFRRLFALEPRAQVESRLAPARRAPALEARGFWAVRPGAFGLEAKYARREGQLAIALLDPLDWVDALHVWVRSPQHPYVRYERPAAPEVVLQLEGVAPTDLVEVYAFGVDGHGNVILELGSERVPRVFGLSAEELAAVLGRDIRGGQVGSYARRLEELGTRVEVHGYLSLELKPVDDVATFDLHHATAMIRADLNRATSLEVALEWEHLGRGAGDFYLPHALIDIVAHEALVLRAGFFEVPVGAFNEYLYPDFLRITGQPPLFSRSVVPALWSEVGVQLRGRLALTPAVAVTYAAFLANGLEQPDPAPSDGVIVEGGDLRAMRFNDRDGFSSSKAVGGRLGLEVARVDLGISGYSGRYTIEGNRRLDIADLDLSYRAERLTLRAEGALAHQEITGGSLRKWGFYTLAALRPLDWIEPYLQLDLVDLPERTTRTLGGLALYPFPRDRATRSLRLKSEVGFDFPEGAEKSFLWFFQLTTGF